MKTTERTICWEIRGRRLVDGALVDQRVATGFGADAASAIRWARYNEPSKMAAFPDADLRAIPDPINLPSAPSLLTSLCLLVSVCAAVGGQSISAGFSCPEAATRAGAGVGKFAGFDSLPRETAGPADLISVAPGIDRKRPHSTEPWLSPDSEGAQSERAVSMRGGSSFPLTSPTENHFPTRIHQRPRFLGPQPVGLGDSVQEGPMIADIAWSIFTFACCILGASMLIESAPRRKRSHLHLLMRAPQNPGAESNREPSAESGQGKRLGFFYGASTPVEPKATQPKETSATNTRLRANGTAFPHEQDNPGLGE